MIIFKFVKLNLKNISIKKTVILIITSAAIIFYAGFIYFTFRACFTDRSGDDIPDRQTDRMIPMLNTEIENETDRHTQSVMYPYYIHEARLHTIEY